MIREALGIALFPIAVFLAGVTWTLARSASAARGRGEKRLLAGMAGAVLVFAAVVAVAGWELIHG